MDKARDEISRHEASLALALRRQPERWFTNAELVAQCGPVSARTVRLHTDRWSAEGLVERVPVNPGHRFRWSEAGARKNAALVKRLERAAEVFGLLAGEETNQ